MGIHTCEVRTMNLALDSFTYAYRQDAINLCHGPKLIDFKWNGDITVFFHTDEWMKFAWEQATVSLVIVARQVRAPSILLSNHLYVYALLCYFLTKTSLEWLRTRMNDKSILEPHGDSSGEFLRLGKANLQKENTRFESFGFLFSCMFRIRMIGWTVPCTHTWRATVTREPVMCTRRNFVYPSLYETYYWK